MKKTQGSRLKAQALCTSCPFHISLPVSCALSLLCLIFLLIACLWYSTPVVNADEVEEHRTYIINRGDQLLISVVGHEKEPTVLAVVRPDGMITYPVVGDVKAAGLTIAQLSADISRRLSVLKFYEDPQVTVQLEVPRQENIYIFGDVEDPGQKQFPRSVSVVEALAAAGGFKDTADLASAIIVKRRKEVITLDLTVLLDDHDAISDRLLNDRLMLEDGDVLIVPSSLKAEKISVIGYVREPGQYPVKSSTTLIKALALAGGPVEPDADLRHIRIIRPDGGVVIADATRSWIGMEQDSPDSSPIPTNHIHPGDSIFVPEKGKLNIFGAVKNQGSFGVDTDISILEALALAGIDEDSSLGNLRIIRSTGERLKVDASEIWERQGPEAEIKLMPGDTLIVPTVFKIDWNMVNVGILILSWVYALLRT
ncbi:polysaccharide biosynthesis/export family protein [Candidatus Poribacteria bacterium]